MEGGYFASFKANDKKPLAALRNKPACIDDKSICRISEIVKREKSIFEILATVRTEKTGDVFQQYERRRAALALHRLENIYKSPES